MNPPPDGVQPSQPNHQGGYAPHGMAGVGNANADTHGMFMFGQGPMASIGFNPIGSFGHSHTQIHGSMVQRSQTSSGHLASQGSSHGQPPAQTHPSPLPQPPNQQQQHQQQQQQHPQQSDFNKKKRVPACDSCNAKKIKCDGLKPMCSMCAKNSRVCTFDRIAEPKTSKRARTVAAPLPSAPSAAVHLVASGNGNLMPSASNIPQQLTPSGTGISANFGMPPQIPPRVGSTSLVDPLTRSLPLRTTPTSQYLPHQPQAQMEQNPQFNFHTMSTSSLQRHPSSQPIAPYGMLGMNQIPQSYDSNSQYPPSQLHPQQLYKQRPQQNLSMPRPQQQAQPSQHQASTQLLQYQPAQAIPQHSMTPTQPNMTNMRTVSSSVSNALVPGAISGGIHGAPQYSGSPQMRPPQQTLTRPTSTLSNLANDSSRTNSSLPLHVTPTAAVATPQSTAIAPRPDPIASLPKEATDDLLRLFFDYIHPTIPLLHPRSFMAGREGESPLLLHTMYALAARYCDHPAVLALGAMYGGGGAGGTGAATTMEDIRARACDAFYFKARDVVDQYMDFARVSTVTAFLLLKCLCSGSGRVSASWMYSGMAVSMIKELQRGRNADDDTVRGTWDSAENGSTNENDWLERERRRRLWWACYVGDRYAAAASDRPTIVMDTDCKLHFPSISEDWVAGKMANPDSPITLDAKLQNIKDFASNSAFVPLTGPQPDHNYFLLLSKLFGRILEFAKVYKTATTNPQQVPQTASDFSNQQLDLQVQLLETSLKSWFAFLPPHLSDPTITQSASGQLRDDAQAYEKQHLHLFYHICHILLHRPKLMHMLRVLPPSTHHASIPPQHCYIKCLAHASEITSLLGRVRARNPHMRFFPPFITCFGVFQSALVHLVRGQVTCRTRAVVVAAPGDDEPGCRAALLHAEALKGLSRDWGLAVKLCTSLVGLIEAAKEGAASVGGRMCDACVSVVEGSPPVVGQQLGQGQEEEVIELHRRDAQFMSHPSGGGGSSSSTAAAEGAFGGFGGLGGIGSWLAGVPSMPHLQGFPGGPGDGTVGTNGAQGASAGNVEDMWHLLGTSSFGGLNSPAESFGFQ